MAKITRRRLLGGSRKNRRTARRQVRRKHRRTRRHSRRVARRVSRRHRRRHSRRHRQRGGNNPPPRNIPDPRDDNLLPDPPPPDPLEYATPGPSSASTASPQEVEKVQNISAELKNDIDAAAGLINTTCDDYLSKNGWSVTHPLPAKTPPAPYSDGPGPGATGPAPGGCVATYPPCKTPGGMMQPNPNTTSGMPMVPVTPCPDAPPEYMAC